ncbi:MAG: Low-affinity inorganic phosphate transporter 1 [Chlamydiae bacterium]|nr:Low-affinity inorganic phosphate transporter 1 [Chlamydiota bacterium]
METALLLKIIVLLIGFYMAWNIGANDVSNAMGTSVGSGALTLGRAVFIAAILEFAGAFFLGGNVSQTMQSELIDVTQFVSDPNTLIFGMCGALLGTGIWLQIASYFGLPVSTTHAIVGAIVGFGALTLGFSGVEWKMVGGIALSWVISPVISGFLSYLIFGVLQRNILYAMNPTMATKRLIPLLLFFVIATFSLSLIFNGLKRLGWVFSLQQALLASSVFGAIALGIGFLLMRRLPTPKTALQPAARTLPFSLISLEKAIKHLRRARTGSIDTTHNKITSILDEMHLLKRELRTKTSFPKRTSEYNMVEKVFGRMQIISACFIAFAHGANDVANAIAPVAAVWQTIKHGVLMENSIVPSWLLAFGGVGIIIGLATWGWRVIETIGRKITELTPTRGFSAELGAAITILLASKIGLPISTTHCLVGSVLGVGLARGLKALNLRMLREIALSWIITLPASAFMSIVCYFLLKSLLS